MKIAFKGLIHRENGGVKMEKRIEVLKAKIEDIQNEWRKNPNYNGCMAEDVRGMLDALDIIMEQKWKFDENGKLVVY